MRFVSSVALAAALLMASFTSTAEPDAPPLPPEPPVGTLIVQVQPFRSETELKPKIEAQLKSGGIEWGVRDGQMVVSLVNKRFVHFDVAQLTRYGSTQTLQLPAGTYRLTTLGFEPRTAFSVEKALDKGAFVNQDIMTFKVEHRRTTTITVAPVMDESRTLFMNFFMPTLYTSVSMDGGADSGEQPADPVAINVRGDASIAWPDYHGPLKFVVK